MSRLRLHMGILLAVTGVALAAAPAQAATVNVTASGFTFAPTTVTIRPSDTVVWNNTNGLHNVHFDDNSYVQPPTVQNSPWQVQRTFGAAGLFRYYCEIHGGPGGSGMAGIVKVTSAPRLSNASPLSMSLVPAHRQTISSSQCTARGGVNSSHGAPLAFSSCNPPNYVPGTIAKLGTQSSASAQLSVVEGNLVSAADEADVSFGLTAPDVRDRQTGGDYLPSAANPDVTMVQKLRLSDTLNGGSQTDPGTTTDFEFPVPAQCAATADPAVGSACSVATSADAVTPGSIKEGRDMMLQVFRVRLNDSGANATRGDGDDRVFAQQGIYIP